MTHLFFCMAIFSTVGPTFQASIQAGEESSQSKIMDHLSSTQLKEKNNVAPLGQAPGGKGLFRDPIEVLGPKFRANTMLSLCEMKLLTYAETIVDRKFTKNGTNTCLNVCCQYRRMMLFDGSVDIKLTESYCGLNGDSVNEKYEPWSPDLSTTCTCVYRINCDLRTSIVLYIFEANCSGYLLVTTPELSANNLPDCIT